MLYETGETDRQSGDRKVFRGSVALDIPERNWMDFGEKVRYVLVVL